MLSIKEMNHGPQLLVICSSLIVFLMIFSIDSRKVEALRLIVQDEVESIINQDFLMTDVDMKLLGNQSDLPRVLEITNQTKNITDINYIDLKNVKFFYADNGTIIADIVFNNVTNYKFNEGTTYGMAININRFPNATKPELIDADYIYKYVYNKGAWYSVLAIEHAGGEERSFAPSRMDSKALNKTENYVRINFNSNKIGKPDSFQVQFFGWTTVNLSNNYTHSLIDVIAWIEVPEQEISLSLDREINKVYPNDTKILNVIIKSTSKLSKTIKLCQNEFCKPVKCNNYCWDFRKINGTVQDSITLSPPRNIHYLPVTLNTSNIGSGKLHIQLFAYISASDKVTATNKPDEKLTVWDLDVGDHWRDRWDYIINLPSHIFTLGVTIITGIVTFLGGLFIDRKSLTSKVKNLFKKE